MNGSVLLAGFTALLTVATIAVILSQRANSAKVIEALGGAVAGSIKAAVSPVLGGRSAWMNDSDLKITP